MKPRFVAILHVTIIALAISVLFSHCETSDPNLLVRVKHNGNTVGQASIYLKLGATLDRNEIIKGYDYMQRADGGGEAYFKGLRVGHYVVYSKGYDSNEGNAAVEGLIEIVISDSPGNNNMRVVVEAN